MSQSKYILIGDVHGCATELEALWQELPLNAHTEIIFLGDLIDRGPDSDGVLKFVFNKQQEYNITVITGNHEYKAQKQIKRELPQSFALTEENISVVNQTHPFYSFEGGKFLSLHAGLYPAFWKHYADLPDLSQQEKWNKKERHRIFRLSICRYVNPEGNIVGLGEETEQDRFWAETYDGKAGHIFFGHQPFLEGIKQFPQATGLDTGCVFGGSLSAAIIYEDLTINYISVSAQKQYAENFFEEEKS